MFQNYMYNSCKLRPLRIFYITIVPLLNIFRPEFRNIHLVIKYLKLLTKYQSKITMPTKYYNNNIFLHKFKKITSPSNTTYCYRNIKLTENRLCYYINWQD